jgi:hypothetical protein
MVSWLTKPRLGLLSHLNASERDHILDNKNPRTGKGDSSRDGLQSR